MPLPQIHGSRYEEAQVASCVLRTTGPTSGILPRIGYEGTWAGGRSEESNSNALAGKSGGPW